jgi:hypothetical protein
MAAGGVIVTDTTWRLMFFLNVPVCAAAVFLAYRVAMPSTRATGGRARLDVIGLALLSPGLAAVIYGLAESGGHGGFTDAHVIAPLPSERRCWWRLWRTRCIAPIR